ncbi:MAG: hypothetical protein RIS29_2139 [Bacteroidota bacterium]|jgi:hypothetical protein
MKEAITNYLIEASTVLSQQASNLSEIKTFDIDCSKLKEFLNEDIRDADDFKGLFKDLLSINGPCVYWYQVIAPDISSKEILESFTAYKNNPERNRAVPAIKSEMSIDDNSKYLYVGKVKRDFYGRVIQHLGCHKTAATQGLQLYYWAKELKLQLKLSVIEFDSSMENLLPVIELAIAEKLKPLIGKHK